MKLKIPWYKILLATQCFWAAILTARMKADGVFEIASSIVIPYIMCGVGVFSIYTSIYASICVSHEQTSKDENEKIQ